MLRITYHYLKKSECNNRIGLATKVLPVVSINIMFFLNLHDMFQPFVKGDFFIVIRVHCFKVWEIDNSSIWEAFLVISSVLYKL